MSDQEANIEKNGFERDAEEEVARIVAQADKTNLTLPSGYLLVPRSIRSLLRVH